MGASVHGLDLGLLVVGGGTLPFAGLGVLPCSPEQSVEAQQYWGEGGGSQELFTPGFNVRRSEFQLHPVVPTGLGLSRYVSATAW